jgi:hypothetical protein
MMGFRNEYQGILSIMRTSLRRFKRPLHQMPPNWRTGCTIVDGSLDSFLATTHTTDAKSSYGNSEDLYISCGTIRHEWAGSTSGDSISVHT